MGGIATASLLEQVNAALHSTSAISISAIAGLAVLAVFAVGGHTVAGILNSFTGQRLVAALRKDVSLRMLNAPVASLERMKSYRLQAILNEDIDTISDFTAECLPQFDVVGERHRRSRLGGGSLLLQSEVGRQARNPPEGHLRLAEKREQRGQFLDRPLDEEQHDDEAADDRCVDLRGRACRQNPYHD
ncbi:MULTISPECIES: ABC transporter transmembrane domain-containing protein [unclassified Variovorax]